MKRHETERLWPPSARCALGVVAVAALTAVLYRLNFRSALLYLMIVVFVSLAGDLVASAVVSCAAFLGLAHFLTPGGSLAGVADPLNVVALPSFLATAFVITRLVSRWRASFREVGILRDQLRLVIDSIPVLSSVNLPNGSVEFVNHQWLEYTGMRREDALGWGWRTALHPDDRAAFTDAGRTAFEKGEPLEIEARLRHADGAYRWFLVRAAPARDALGNIVRWYAVSVDIEDRKVAEALLAGEKRLLEMMARRDALPVVLDALCRLVEEQSGDGLCSILLLSADRHHLRHGAAPSLPRGYTEAIDGAAIGPAVGSCGTAAYRAEPVIVSDIATDPLWVDYRELALAHSLRACWSVPLLASDGRVLGTFAMYHREPRHPRPHERDVIDRITPLAAVAVERAQAEEALHQAQAELARVARVTTVGELAVADETGEAQVGHSGQARGDRVQFREKASAELECPSVPQEDVLGATDIFPRLRGDSTKRVKCPHFTPAAEAVPAEVCTECSSDCYR